MIGNAEEAEFIHYWHHDAREELDYSFEAAPDGWDYLGEGCYRTAYLAPSGVVYKVQQDEGHSYQSNYGEWNQWKRLFLGCKMPKHSRLPWLSYHALPGRKDLGVIAMERFRRSLNSVARYGYESDGDIDYWSVLPKVQQATGVGDLYGSNLMIDDKNKLLVPTDLGDSSSEIY